MGRETLTNLLTAAATETPDAPALVEWHQNTSFAALEEMARRAATGLVSIGIGRGDRIALWLPNRPAHYALHFAAWRLGATVVGVNTRFKSREIEDVIGRSGAKALVFWPGFKDIDFTGILAEIEPSALSRLERVVVYDGEQAAGHGAEALPEAVLGRPVTRWSELVSCEPMHDDAADPDLPAQIFTTSGTTSRPKFVLHTQRSLAHHAPRAAEAWGAAAPDAVLFQAAPLCGVVGLVVGLLAIAKKRPQVLQTLFDAADAAELIREHAVTHMIATDEMWARIFEARAEPKPFPSLRATPSFGANPPLARYLEMADSRGLPLVNAYGMSECMALFALQRPDAPLVERSVGGGYPVDPAYGVRVCDPDGDTLLPTGEEGEIQVSGPCLMREYADNPEANAKAWTEDGWLRTGDLGRLGEDGRLVYISRMGDMLRLAGFLVGPSEIEAEIERHPSVEQAQVVGIRTERGAKAFAWVRPRAGGEVDEAELQAHCRSRLADYKVPVRIRAIDAFPVTESPNAVKIQRVKLAAMAQDDWDRAGQPASE